MGTIDQALLSALMVSHAHLRATALLRHLLVVDEVHASDAYMTALLQEVLDYHVRAGGHALLMSATLGATARDRLLRAGDCSLENGANTFETARSEGYPLVTHCLPREPSEHMAVPAQPMKRVRRYLSLNIDKPDAIAREALSHAARGARVLVLRNTVRNCIATQVELEAAAKVQRIEELLFACGGVRAPHHSRFAKTDREALDAALEQRFGKDAIANPCVVVATQTVQQSLDIDADLLITDLCPMDVLLQRIGRLHRHPRARPTPFLEPVVVVLTPSERDLTGRLRKDGQARGSAGIGSVYDDLRIIEATWRVLEREDVLCIPQMNRALVEDSTHPKALQEIVMDLGEAWRAHATRLQGAFLADRRIATLNLVDRSKPFGEFEFPTHDLERRIQTRLGEGDRLVQFIPPLSGPFHHAVSHLSIPAYQARGAPVEAEATELSSAAGVVTFRFGPRRFVYDRLGLRVAPEGSSQEEEEEELADA